MRFSQLMGLTRFYPLARQPALRQFEEDDRLRLVDFEERRRVHVHTDENHARVVCRPVSRVAFLRKPYLPVRSIQLVDFCRSRVMLAKPDTDTHSRVRSL